MFCLYLKIRKRNIIIFKKKKTQKVCLKSKEIMLKFSLYAYAGIKKNKIILFTHIKGNSMKIYFQYHFENCGKHSTHLSFFNTEFRCGD